MRKIVLALLVCMLLTLLAPLCAFAEEPSPAERGLAAIASASNGNCIILPKEESFLEEWKVLYARKPWYQPALQVECLPKLKTGAPLLTALYEGTRVTVVAEENDMSCMLYPGPDSKMRVGWIQSIRLLEEFPGTRYTLDERGKDEYKTVETVGHHWSNSFFKKSEQRYLCLDEPVENCVGFTLQYQVYAYETPYKESVFGPRTLHVFDGETWTEVAVFPYGELGAVEVDVQLDKPMKIVAFHTTADCECPYSFDCRAYAYAFLTE